MLKNNKKISLTTYLLLVIFIVIIGLATWLYLLPIYRHSASNTPTSQPSQPEKISDYLNFTRTTNAAAKTSE
jgi:flagellar basal body-associated protein FliL